MQNNKNKTLKNIRKITKNHPIELANYVNVETGESLASELVGEGKTITVQEDSGTRVINSDNYCTVDCDVLIKISGLISNADLAYLTKMFPLTKTDSNILYNNNCPYTNQTLQKYLGISSVSKFSELMSRLDKVGAIRKKREYIKESRKMVFAMNPFLSRKRKTITVEEASYFIDFR